MSGFAEILQNNPEFVSVTDDLKSGKYPVHITGMTGSQKSHYIYSLCKELNKKCLVITYDEIEAGRICQDLSFLFGADALFFKNKEYVFYDVDASSHISEISRLKVLGNMNGDNPVVTTIDAVSKYTMPPDVFKHYVREIKVGDIIETDALLDSLVNMGYTRSGMIDGVGQFSVRGSIIDIFSPLCDNPVRIDLFDDEVDSLREFDPQTQVSIDNIDLFKICPVREIVYNRDKALEVSKLLKLMKNENFMADADKLREGGHFSTLDKYMPYFYEQFYTILDYTDDDYLIFLDEVKQLSEKSRISYKEQNEIITNMLEKGIFPKNKKTYMLDYNQVLSSIKNEKFISISSLSHSCTGFSPKALGAITAKTLHGYSGKVDFLYDDLRFWKKNGYRIILVLNGEQRVKNIVQYLHEEGIDCGISTVDNAVPPVGHIYAINGNLIKGFEYPESRVVVVSDGETQHRKPKVKRKKNSKDVIKSFDDLNKGDYVVHRTHGIGKYAGIAQLSVDGVTKDFLKIKYKGSDILYVPTNQLDFLHKYTGGETARVKVNSLGGGQWNKTVSKVKESVAALAEDLIKLYAERSNQKGHVFDVDTPWQKEFEENFPYEETEDQLRCIREVKDDMEKGKCMDRLLCGDVGYGKTEVAIRAAFKCVMGGMQVAYLVPTTILAQQHYNTFSSRLGEYAMRVDMLSRFRTGKQQRKTLEGLKSGSVDVVIGTHRLIQKDVKFKNLGLLIIDEEQRFGVGHKEKLKEIKKDVDVLTLSATPIPRTLNMAMVGIRDLSVLSAPPSDRFPVQTFVMEYNETVILNAIQKELERQGQVYYLFNRIDGIDKVASKIQNMLPDARVAVAHGRMTETQLEEIMMSLIEGDIDVLVCTTIIETGLDVSNVNTIIIENADCLGLSQLYQLRGRVGRSNRLAYAYLTYFPGKILDSVAHKRLQAIKEFTEFGSGFKIAMRDLEIRGAGNLLGKEQHGNMNLVGYDMYCQLLQQAVKETKGEKYIPPIEVTVDIKVDAYIPEKYVEFEQQRIDLYKKIASIDCMDEYYDVQGEFIDRFGDMPKCVVNLLDISIIKSMCRICEISDVLQQGESIRFTFTDNANPGAVVKLISQYDRKMKFVNGKKSALIYKCSSDVISNIKIMLQNLVKAIQEDT